MDPMCAQIMYPVIPENTLMMSMETLRRTTVPRTQPPRTAVCAATLLKVDSSTEVIDVNSLCQKSSSVIRYVEIADMNGRLHCVDGHVRASCWLKIVTLAEDCQSCNVILRTVENGVILKVIKSITPGEPLLMWFAENILAMTNIPFLTPVNIQGQNRYICHLCNNLFEYPNPLKIHIALKCNRLDNNHFWSALAKEFDSTPPKNLSLSVVPQKANPFLFKLGGLPQTSPMETRVSPILVNTRLNSNVTLTNMSPGSSNQPSPSSTQPSPGSSTQPSPGSSTHLSPNSSNQVSPNFSNQMMPVHENAGHCNSAFKPYINQPHFYPERVMRRGEPMMPMIPPEAYRVQPPPIRPEVHAAQMETIVSNLGKSKKGHLCVYCGKVYSRKYGLKIHIRTHTGYKPLKCSYCLRPFGDPSNLNKHVRLHADGETPYKCDLCGKVLVRRRDLERHVKSRHQDNAEDISLEVAQSD